MAAEATGTRQVVGRWIVTHGHEALDARRIDVIVLISFVIIVAVMTYPQVLHLADGTRDWGDPLLNSWIMWWEVHAVSSGNLAGFFDANIFFPYHDTLAFSEYLLPQTLVAAPLLLLFDNPVIAYNVVLLLSFLATAFCMYLLGKYLTGDPFAGFVAGLAMAFSPFMFSHLSHVQIIGAAGIPLAFLFLQRYFDDGALPLRMLLCFSAAYIGQALANAYYAVYLTYAAAAYIGYRALHDRLLGKGRLYRHLALHAGLSVALLAPFFSRYFLVTRELGFVRDMGSVAYWYSFLAAPPINRMYGTLTDAYHNSEAALLPGLTVITLAAVGVLSSRAASIGGNPSARATGNVDMPPRPASWTYRTFGVVLAVEWLVIVAISITGGFALDIAGVELRVYGFKNPFTAIIVAGLLRAGLRHWYPALRRTHWLAEPQRFYSWMLLISAILTLGPTSPYRLLYTYVPGFSSIRATPRIHVLTVFCLAVFVAYGTRAVARRLTLRRLSWAAAALPVLVLAEFFSSPLPMHEVKWGDEIPPVYQWLARQQGDDAVLELPLDHRAEFTRMLYSTIHGKPLVNGASGYPAPVYEELAIRADDFPSTELIDDARSLGVRWIVVHRDEYGAGLGDIDALLGDYADVLRPVAEVGSALVLETPAESWRTRDDFPAPPDREPRGPMLPRAGWTVHASVNDFMAPLAIDGDLTTRWHSETQRRGDTFTVDLGTVAPIGGIVLRLGRYPHDYPRGWRVEGSIDGEEWWRVGRDLRVRLPITSFLHPRGLTVEMPLHDVRARYLRLVQVRRDRTYSWSIHELELLDGATGSDAGR
ncbi:MAG: discoidin domain-containing protein [Acidobacteriota bacterium]|jgi:hypothetical protein